MPRISRRTLTGSALTAPLGMAAAGLTSGGAATTTGRPRWTTAAPMALERQELYPEVMNGRIYVAGGLVNPSTGLSAHFDAYDPARDSWIQLATLPDARHHISLAKARGELYGIGGFPGGFPRWRAQADVFVYDPRSDTWRVGTPLPRPRAESVTESVRDRIHVVGGRVRSSPTASSFVEHRDTDLHEMFDPRTGRWTRRAPAPTPRNSAASAVIDGLVYVVGGRQFSLGPAGQAVQTNVATLEVYDPRTDRWETRSPLPQPRGGLAAAAHRGRLYAFGGEQQSPTPAVYAEVWRYQPRTDTWTQLPSLPTPRHGLGAATVGDRIHTVGGGVRAGGSFATVEHEVLVLGRG